MFLLEQILIRTILIYHRVDRNYNTLKYYYTILKLRRIQTRVVCNMIIESIPVNPPRISTHAFVIYFINLH